MLVFAVYSNGNTWLTTDLNQLQAKLQSERGLIDKRIDQLEPHLPVEGSELVPVFQNGQTRRVTIDQILDEAEDRITQGSSFRRKVELTGSRSLLPSDIGAHLFYPGSTPITITIPDNIFTDPQQDLIDVEIAQLGTGVVTITPADVTVNGVGDSLTLTQNKSIVLVFYSSDTVNVLSGNSSGGVAATDDDIGNRTADPTQVPSGNVGKLTQWFSWLTNRIKTIVGKTNWYDAPDITLASTKTRLDGLDTSVADRPTSSAVTSAIGSAVSGLVSDTDSRLSNQRVPTDGSVSLVKLASGFSLPWANVNKSGASPADVGADAAGTAAGLLMAHEGATNPHSQYVLTSEIPTVGTIATQNANNVAITGGAINGTVIGGTTASTVRGTTGTFTATTASSGTTTGAITSAGGAGIAGSVNVGGYLGLRATSTSTLIQNLDGGSGNDALLDWNLIPNGNNGAIVRFFRSTNTTATARFIIGTADNTSNVNCQFGGNTTSFLNAINSNVGLGLVPNTSGAKTQSLDLYVGTAAAVAPGAGNIQASGSITAGAGFRVGSGATISAILTATKVISTPSSSDTITVTAAVVGDHVMLSRGAGGFVSAANTVQFDSTGLSGVTVRATVFRVA